MNTKSKEGLQNCFAVKRPTFWPKKHSLIFFCLGCKLARVDKFKPPALAAASQTVDSSGKVQFLSLQSF